MTLILPPNPDDLLHEYSPTYIDSSMISTFRSCKRKFYWNYVRKMRPRGESIHLVAGGALAAGLEGARRAQFCGNAKDNPLHLDDLLHAAIGPFTRAWTLDHEAVDQTKNFHNTFHALEAYLTEYHPFNDPVQPFIKPNGDPATEFTFTIPLPVNCPNGDPYTFVGRFDLLGLYGDLMVVQDEKTTSALGSYWMQQWDLRGQFLGYTWACRQLGYPVDHCIVRGIAILKTQHTFASVPVQFSNVLIDRWYEELLNTCHEINHYFELKKWPYNFADACSSYGGCGYKDLCKAANADDWLNNYELNHWDPIHADAGG
jgi:hypothetical protein